MLSKALITAALLGLAAPTLAQTDAPVPNPDPNAKPLPVDRGYDKDTPRGDAINAQEHPVTHQLNAAANADAQAGTTAIAIDQTQYAVDQAQYARDMDAYRGSVVSHSRAIARDQQRYENQQRAYADAMWAWRMQVAACKRGHVRACKAPTPNPADFY